MAPACWNSEGRLSVFRGEPCNRAATVGRHCVKALASTMIGQLRVGYGWIARARLVGPVSRQHWAHLGYLLAGCLLVAAPLFYLGLSQVIVTDHFLHIGLIQRGIEHGTWPVHFLFPAAVYALSGFSREIGPLSRAAVVVLTTCMVAKAWLTYGILARRTERLPSVNRENLGAWSHATLLLVIAVALLVSAPIVRPWWIHRVYLGQISPNVWHNPTSIVCWPLVILLFFAGDDFLRSGRLKMLSVLGALSAASVLAKPNYFLAFAPVFGLLVLRRFGLSRALILSQLALIPTVLLLCWQLAASFDGPDAMRPGRHIAFMPLAAWRLHSRSIPLSLLFSLAFPLSYLVLFWRTLKNRELLLFAWGVMLSALAWALCFTEVLTSDGTVEYDFNFSWGAHLALYVLFLVTALDMLQSPAAMRALTRGSTSGWREKLPWWLLGAHAVSGVFWIIRQAAGRGFR